MSKGLLNALVAVSFVCFLPTAGAAAKPLPSAAQQPVRSVEGIAEYRLPNGLQILLVPDDSKPTTTVNVTYHVGSRYENYGETGMAHLLEHLMFKGSPAHRNPKADFTRRGLNFNGSTSFDRTNYFASFAANDENLKWYLEWQADAMVHSFIARGDLDSEMTVVRNEMESGENNPQTVLWQHSLAQMYDWHNYGKSTIGARSDVENVDIPRLQAFYREYYQPDNATLIVAGKFEPAKVLGWVQQAFGKLPRPKRVLPTLYTLDPTQDGERSFTMRRVGGVPMVQASYHVPAASDPDYAAMEALAIIFSDEPSGRLHRQLVQTQRAASVFGFSWDLADPGVAMFGAELAAGQDVNAARDALLASLESLAKDPITAEELTRAKLKWRKSWDQAFNNPETVGVSLSSAIGQGDWRLFFLIRDRVAALTLAQVQRVATAYLVPSNRTLGLYQPTDKPERAPAPKRIDVAAQLKDFTGDAALSQAEAFEATPANIDAKTQHFTLPSGLQAALLPKATRGSAVHATLNLRYGDLASLAGQREVAQMAVALLDKGTAHLDRQAVQDKLDALQTEIGFGGDAGTLTATLLSRRDKLPQAIALLGELLREPSFPPEALEEIRQQALSGLEQQRHEPDAVVENAIERHGNPYPRGDVRYARSFDEIEADIKAVTIEQVRAFHRQFFGAAYAQFAAVGDLDAGATQAALTAAFGDWKSPAPFVRIPEPAVAVPPARLVFRTPDKQNAVLNVRQTIAMSDNDPDYPAFQLANWLLGGSGGDSRLWKRIREQDGLSYGVGSYVSWSNFEPNSSWDANAIFAPQNRDKVEADFNEEIKRALDQGFTAEEVREGVRGLLNFRRLGRAQDTRLAPWLATNLYLGRDFRLVQHIDEELARLTPQQVNAALRKYLQPGSFVFGLGGDFAP